MEMVKKIQHFVRYWYQRYLLATELYMVEPWEKAVIQILFVVLFGLFSYFNYSILLYGVSQLRGTIAVSMAHDQKN